VSDTAVPAPTTPSVSATSSAWSLPSRLMAFFSGPAGLIVKFSLLGLLDAFAIWAIAILAGRSNWIACSVLIAATAGINAVYLIPRRWTLPLKFLIPGTVFLVAFQVIPVFYTIDIAFTNYASGHIISKPDAVTQIKQNSLAQTPDSSTYTLSPALDKQGKLVLLLVDDDTQKTYVGTRSGLQPLARSQVAVANGAITAASGYTLLRGAKLFTLDTALNNYRVPISGSRAIHPEGIDNAVELQPTLRFDPKADTFTSIKSGVVYRDNGEGSYAAASGTELAPGWKTYIGWKNFSSVLHNRLIRNPFLRVFAWTLSFAVLTVLLSFALGLFLAITLQKPIRFQKLYRTAFVIPYAIPSFLTILVWAGLLNDDYGIVNHILHTNIPFLFDTWWARFSIILVSIWLTFPYFFLVSLGALQSIPAELVEAARVDGGGAWQVFRKITLPLLLVAVAPLMIASFAFNFNNFNTIYLLTTGGPPAGDQSIAGTTDILISYTYKVAFASGKGQDYALASAISIFIFFIVAAISMFGFWRSRTLESLQ
jgi:arabinogalactan oligomer / maltooligosaccharide transport system permease protein